MGPFKREREKASNIFEKKRMCICFWVTAKERERERERERESLEGKDAKNVCMGERVNGLRSQYCKQSKLFVAQTDV